MARKIIIEPRNRSFFSFPGLKEALHDARAVDLCEKNLINRLVADGSHWEIYVEASGSISLQAMSCLEKALIEAVPGISSAIVKLSDPIPVTAENLKAVWDDLLVLLRRKAPLLRSLLAGVSWALEEDRLLMLTPHEAGADLLKKKDLEGMIRYELSRVFKEELKVSYHVEPSLLENLYERREEPRPEATSDDSPPLPKKAAGQPAKRRGSREKQGEGPVLLGRKINGKEISVGDLDSFEGEIVIIKGEVVNLEARDLRTGRRLVNLDVFDGTDTITVKVFEDGEDFYQRLFTGQWLTVRGKAQTDRFSRELVVLARDVQQCEPARERCDEAPEKRIELHLHTKLSTMDSTVELEDIVKLAKRWGHPALAVTDHGGVQAFPAAAVLARKYGVKMIYGMEGYLADGEVIIVQDADARDLDTAAWVVFDVETTGLKPYRDEIIEIGAVRMERGEILGSFRSFIKPARLIPPNIQALTGITQEMVEQAPGAREVLGSFLEFCGGAVLVAHNAPFDMAFLREALSTHLGRHDFNPPLVDTIPFARIVWPGMKNYKLNTLARELEIPLENHHRAVDDAACAAKILLKALEETAGRGLTQLSNLNQMGVGVAPEMQNTYHILLLAKNQVGMKNLYKIVSCSHLQYFYRTPKIPRSLLTKFRQGILLGSACEAGELFQAVLSGAPEERLVELAGFYDFLEIHPLGNNEFLVRQEKLSREDLIRVNRTILELGTKLGIPVVATSDTHFIKPEDEIFRRILLAGQGFEDAEKQAPLYYRTTCEMLAEYSYLGEDKARELVIENPRRIAGLIEEVSPVPEAFHPPKIEGAESEIKEMAFTNARRLYGEKLPALVEDRLKLELRSIIGHGYAVLFLIAHKLVKKSMDDGYLVGSRGSVGSSLVATMCGITEVNPLPPHYLCPECRYSEFLAGGQYGSGFDLPDKACPRCGHALSKNGHDIPFATFMGFEGDKEPDIDLNFSGEYQAVIHKYTEELFGRDYVFRAGTITSLADKMAYGFVRGYMEDKGIRLRNAEINRLVRGCTGVKRSTGQHPGGMVVVPRDQEIYNFTPIQYPANDKNAGWITTHFDFHSALEGRLVKLDLLGHDDPTVIRMLQDLTGIKQDEIPFNDPRVMRLFSSAEPLGLNSDELGFNLGTLGIPEFGTEFVRQMLMETKPKTFAELVYISGLSHGTGVWLGNAQELIRAGKVTLSEVISTRDDIMNYLIYQGMQPKTAFKIMEKVRKGKGLAEEDYEEMKKSGIPDWYMSSCQKIKYMFPKAHAAAYVLMALRIAYFKVYYPGAFYSSYFTVRADEFDADLVVRGAGFVRDHMEALRKKGGELTAKDGNLYTILEVVYEAMLRGVRFLRVDLYKSSADKFNITPDGLLPPLKSLQGLGESAASNIVEAREKHYFTSVEDLKARARLSSAVIEVLGKHGCLEGLMESDQLRLFG
ncbi:MAG: PolC-type DNA polymerase III [Bacillota bacterium]